MKDIPDRINGRRYILGIARTTTVATARFGAGLGWYAGGLWRGHGADDEGVDGEVWNVRTCDDHSYVFPCETHAVSFFLDYMSAVADGWCSLGATPWLCPRRLPPVDYA